ncbi:MAG: putative rane protein [Acidobacteriales bacterium]|nr:putative rane protein [Terriglobales bacterium]
MTDAAVNNYKKSSWLDGWLFVAAPGVIWGASFLFIAEGLKALGPNGVSFTRILVGFVTLSLFPAARKLVDRSAWRGIALLALVWFAFPLSMFPFAEQRVSSAITGMLNAATPMFVAIVAALIARKLPEARVIIGLSVGMTGAAIMALPSVSAGSSSAIGVALIVAATLSYGFALNVARPLQQRYGALPVIWRALGVAAVLTLPLGGPDLLDAHWSTTPIVSLLALGALGTGVAFVLLATAVGKVGATRASASAFLMPPVSLVLGVGINHEHVALLSLVGSAVCLSGAWLMRPKTTAGNPRVVPKAIVLRAHGHSADLPTLRTECNEDDARTQSGITQFVRGGAMTIPRNPR